MDEGIAVSFSDYQKYGCVKCGCDYCFNYSGISGGGTIPVKCGECEEKFIILADGVMRSRIGFGTEGDGEFHYPELVEHPRKGIPKHKFELPDIRPDGEGEYFKSRGCGYDLAGFVKCKAAGERIVQMFKELLGNNIKTWLDYREHEPTWIQVKISPLDVNMHKMHELVKDDGIITKDKIKQAMYKSTLRVYTSMNPNFGDCNLPTYDNMHIKNQIGALENNKNKWVNIFTFSPVIMKYALNNGLEVIHAETGKLFTEKDFKKWFKEYDRAIASING